MAVVSQGLEMGAECVREDDGTTMTMTMRVF